MFGPCQAASVLTGGGMLHHMSANNQYTPGQISVGSASNEGCSGLPPGGSEPYADPKGKGKSKGKGKAKGQKKGQNNGNETVRPETFSQRTKKAQSSFVLTCVHNLSVCVHVWWFQKSRTPFIAYYVFIYIYMYSIDAAFGAICFLETHIFIHSLHGLLSLYCRISGTRCLK